MGWRADNLAVHEVAQADKARGDRGSDGNVVEHMPQVHVGTPIIQVEGYH